MKNYKFNDWRDNIPPNRSAETNDIQNVGEVTDPFLLAELFKTMAKGESELQQLYVESRMREVSND